MTLRFALFTWVVECMFHGIHESAERIQYEEPKVAVQAWKRLPKPHRSYLMRYAVQLPHPPLHGSTYL